VELGDPRRLVRLEQAFRGELLRRCGLGGVIDVGARVRFFGANLREAFAVGPADEHRLLARRLLVGRFERLAPVDLEVAEHRHFLRPGGERDGQQGEHA
jgi:hypothetical protein